MARIVQKYGGTSVGDVDRIKNVAGRIKATRDAGNELVVVVSARAGVTNELLARAKALCPLPSERELDQLLAIGEQETIALTAMALHGIGVRAVSYTGAQAGIFTDKVHTKAKIRTINAAPLEKDLSDGNVIIVAGFQGINDDGQVTTLGRGGSDLTAIALAAAIQADKCEIYTDVDGVYTTDPRIVAKARKQKAVTYEEMLELASVGAKVLQTRSVGLAMKEGVRVQVLSSFIGEGAPPADDLPGTMIVSDEEMDELVEKGLMERQLVTGIAHDKNEAKVILTRVPDRPGAVANIFEPLAAASINVDMIIQNVGRDKGETDVTFTVPQSDLARAQALLEDRRSAIGFNRIITDSKIAKISVVGVGMKSNAGVASTMFRALSERGINIQAISTSEIKISVMIDEDETELAVRVLHTAYGLDAVS